MKNLLLLLLPLLAAACSLPPDRPVTRNELMQSRLYNLYIIDESPEEVLDALNRNGEAIIEAKRNIPDRDYPVHVKILATSEGLEVMDYDK